jgi:hypothetical protein
VSNEPDVLLDVGGGMVGAVASAKSAAAEESRKEEAFSSWSSF